MCAGSAIWILPPVAIGRRWQAVAGGDEPGVSHRMSLYAYPASVRRIHRSLRRRSEARSPVHLGLRYRLRYPAAYATGSRPSASRLQRQAAGGKRFRAVQRGHRRPPAGRRTAPPGSRVAESAVCWQSRCHVWRSISSSRTASANSDSSRRKPASARRRKINAYTAATRSVNSDFNCCLTPRSNSHTTSWAWITDSRACWFCPLRHCWPARRAAQGRLDQQQLQLLRRGRHRLRGQVALGEGAMGASFSSLLRRSSRLSCCRNCWNCCWTCWHWPRRRRTTPRTR